MDWVSNFICMIKVNTFRKKDFVIIFLSKKILLLVECLYIEGFISGYKFNGNNIIVYLKYEGGEPVIKEIKRISKFSNRKYMTFKELRREAKKNKYYIISTDKGLIYTKNYLLLDKYIGGEVICLLC